MTAFLHPRYRVGGWLFDAASGQLHGNGRVVTITPKASALLIALGEGGGELVSKSALFERVWPERDVSDAALTTAMRELRDALGDDARKPRFIGTLHRRGYKLLVPWQKDPGSDRRVCEGATDPIGRERELATLDAALARVLGGQRQVIFIGGEPGIGKSTLLDAFIDGACARAGLAVARGHCIEHHGLGEPYMPLLEAMGRLAESGEQARVVATLRRAAPSWLAQLPACIDPAEQVALLERTTGVTRERMLREWCDAIERIAAEQPLVIALEDVHWCDESTLDAVNAIARRRGPAPLMLLATFRTGTLEAGTRRVATLCSDLALANCATSVHPALWSSTDVGHFIACQRPALAPEAVNDLARALHARTEGNPLFVANLLRLSDEAGGASPAAPTDLRGAIRRQLELLNEHERRVLDAAAVVGMQFETAAVAAGLGDERAVEPVCRHLADRQVFVAAVAAKSGERYEFRHALYREELYAELAGGRRAELHLRIGRYLEATPDAVAESALLADHFDRGNDPVRAVFHYRSAGESAARWSAPREAAQHLQRALELLRHLPEGTERTESEVALLIALGAQLMALRGWGAPEVERAYSRAQALSERSVAGPGLFPALWGLWLFRWGHGELDAARELCDRLKGLSDRSNNPTLRLQTHHASWATCISGDDYAGAIAHARAAAAAAAAVEPADALRFGNHDALVCGDSMAAVALTIVGDESAARACSARALARARALQHPFTSALALFFAAMLHEMLDEAERCLELAEASHAEAVDHGFELFRGWSDAIAGWALAASGRSEQGIERLQSGIARAEATGTSQLLAYLVMLQADGCLRARQLDAARAAVERGLRMMGTRGGVHRGELLRLSAQLDPHRRAELLKEARDVAERLSSPWLTDRIERRRSALCRRDVQPR
jgi:DNA-binding winged helix-turn-helix (wHTH) protein